jgi:hypothetical protein
VLRNLDWIRVPAQVALAVILSAVVVSHAVAAQEERILSGDTTYTLEDRAVLAEFSAKLYDTDAMKKLRIE